MTTRLLDLICMTSGYNLTGMQEFVDINLGPALAEVALFGNYQLNGTEIVSSGANGTSTFLTVEDAENYLFNLHKNDCISDVNIGTGGVPTFTLGTLIKCQQEVKDEIDKRVLPKVDKTTTVNGHDLSTNVTITKGDVGLGNVDNTSDASKPVSTATQTVLNTKANTASLASVAITGSYNDLGSKPNLATVATTGSYNDLSNKPTIPTLPTRSFANSASRALTTGTGATGFLVSSTRDAIVNYSVTINTSVSLSGNSTGYVVLEIASTNSATAGDWIEVGRTPSGQSGTLVIGLVLNQIGGGQVGTVIPAGYYAKLRTVNTAGTPTYTYNSGQEVLI